MPAESSAAARGWRSRATLVFCWPLWREAARVRQRRIDRAQGV